MSNDVFWYTAYIKNIGSLQPSRKGSISLSALFYLILLCIFLVFQYVGIRRTLGVDFWNWAFDSGPLGGLRFDIQEWILELWESILASGSQF